MTSRERVSIPIKEEEQSGQSIQGQPKREDTRSQSLLKKKSSPDTKKEFVCTTLVQSQSLLKKKSSPDRNG